MSPKFKAQSPKSRAKGVSDFGLWAWDFGLFP